MVLYIQKSKNIKVKSIYYNFERCLDCRYVKIYFYMHKIRNKIYYMYKL